jgi:hypothetical protein
MPGRMDDKELVRLARVGAAARLTELERERAVLLRAFPELRRAIDQRGGDGAPAARAPKRRRSGMSAAARKAVSVRMKKYWAERRSKRKAHSS